MPSVINYIRNSANLLFDNLMVMLNREGSFHTESVPDGKLPAGNHRQLRCYCPLAPEGVSVKQESIPGRVSWFLSTIRNTSLGPCTTGIPACVPQGLGDGDFHFSDIPVTAEVCLDILTQKERRLKGLIAA